jgi:HPt (histidine-containing phosphotransfer) domain-containing protein
MALDPNVLRELAELDQPGEPSLLEQLGKMFLDSTPAKTAEMRALLARGELKSAQKVAHALKSASGAFGATQFSGFCATLEYLEGPGSLARAQSLLASIEAEYLHVKAELAHTTSLAA